MSRRTHPTPATTLPYPVFHRFFVAVFYRNVDCLASHTSHRQQPPLSPEFYHLVPVADLCRNVDFLAPPTLATSPVLSHFGIVALLWHKDAHLPPHPIPSTTPANPVFHCDSVAAVCHKPPTAPSIVHKPRLFSLPLCCGLVPHPFQASTAHLTPCATHAILLLLFLLRSCAATMPGSDYISPSIHNPNWFVDFGLVATFCPIVDRLPSRTPHYPYSWMFLLLFESFGNVLGQGE